MHNQKLFATYSFLLDRAWREMRRYSQHQLKAAGVPFTIEQIVILKSLMEEDALSQKELAERVGKDTPTVTRMLDLLCDQGYTVRNSDPDDRRKFSIVLTEEGKKAIEKAMVEVFTIRKDGWEGLTMEDMMEFNRILQKLIDNFKQ